MKHSTNLSLYKDTESLIEPHVAPVFASEVVSSPLMGNLMGSNINLGLILSDNGWWSKSKKWVLHTTHWVGLRQDEDPVVTPDVSSEVLLSLVKQFRKDVKSSDTFVHESWLCYDIRSITHLLLFQVTTCNSNQVRWNLDLVWESVVNVSIVYRCSIVSTVGTHVDLKLFWDSDISIVCDLVGWSVLHWGNGSAGNIFTLGVHVWCHFANSLILGHPANSGWIGIGHVCQLKVKLLISSNIHWQFNCNPLSKS